MQKSTEDKARKKGELIRSMAVQFLLRAAMAAVLLLLAWRETGILRWLALSGAALEAAVLIGSILALGQRLKEIEGGEEDAASQY